MFTYALVIDKDFYVGDYGIDLVCQIDEDISDASAIKFRFVLPNNTRVDKTGSFYSDGHDGLVKYNIESGFLAAAGNYGLQLELTFSSAKYYTEIEYFYVNENIEDV